MALRTYRSWAAASANYDSWLTRGCCDYDDEPECQCCGESVADEVEWDSDGEHQWAEVPELCSKCERRGCDTKVGRCVCEQCGGEVPWDAERGEVCGRCFDFADRAHSQIIDGSDALTVEREEAAQ